MGRKGWGSLNGNNISGGGQGGYNAPDADRFDGFEETAPPSRGYQSHSSKAQSPVGDSDNGNAAAGGGGWSDWDDDKATSNGGVATAS